MPHYNVAVGLVLNEHYQVEADNEDDAAEKAFDLFRESYELPHDGQIVLDFVELTEPDPEDDDDTPFLAGADQ